ncbi:DUF6089 family protein [Chryseolinea sp. T2]|uniref:type IX secretion system protein PorG n=1 Tax=Chryseolinea sp. T2 TaxID=3129255 RepID=UPI0030789C75
MSKLLRTFFTALSIALLFAENVTAQSSEVGFGLGTFNYTGDLVQFYNFKYSKPAATVFYRSNLSNVVSLRAAITAGLIGASEVPTDAFATQRNASFKHFLFEASTVAEYHFLNWRDSKRFVRFTPYLFGGVALFGFSGDVDRSQAYSTVQMAIPFGGGVKYVLNPKWYLSLEFGMRKTFFDYLDNVSGGDFRNKNYQYGNDSNNDHYYFLGFSITRTFYTIPCPTNPYR